MAEVIRLRNSIKKTSAVSKNPHPEVEPVPRLLLDVDAVGLGSADGPHVRLMALLEVDELDGGKGEPLLNRVGSVTCGFVQHQGKGSHFISHLWDKRRAARDGVHYP